MSYELLKGNSDFPETAWSTVIKARDRTVPDYKEKLGSLVTKYWTPVYNYVRYCWSATDEEAADLTQEYFAAFLEKDYLRPVSREKGRFRTYIRVTLKHFLLNVKEKRTAIKRGLGASVMSFDEIPGEPVEAGFQSDPFIPFDQEWARTVLGNSITNLREELISNGKELYFLAFKKYYMGSDDKISTYDQICRELNLKRNDLINYLRYARNLYRRMIVKEISQYVENQSEIDDEVKYLLSIRL